MKKDEKGVFRAEVFVVPTLNQEEGTLELVSGIKMGDIEEVLQGKMLELEDMALTEYLVEQGWTPPPKV